ncbi:MAG TPA: nucleotidyltransferase family protein [Burkholderiales bacterium]|nr:nucleotidyltransferase family protein [Burkholderiales bacterium]
MQSEELISRIRQHKKTLHAMGVKSLEIFGSVVKGEARPDSDLDLLVEFQSPATFDGYMDVKLYLEELTGRRVDLVTRAALKPRLKSSIEAEAVRVA